MELINCIYRFLNDKNEIIYVGKATNLRLRLENHRHLSDECYTERKRIEFTVFETEDEMDFAERYYIPKYKPKYNDALTNKTINFNIYEFDNAKWYEFGSKTHIRTQIIKDNAERLSLLPKDMETLEKKEQEQLKHLDFIRKLKALPYDIKSLENEERMQLKFISNTDLNKKEKKAQLEKLASIQTKLKEKRSMLFEYKTGKNPNTVEYSDLMLENGVFSLEELFEFDINKIVVERVEHYSKKIEKDGYYDVTDLHADIAFKFNTGFPEEMWKIKYLKALNLKGLEGRTGTAYEVVERVIKKLKKT